MMHDPTLMNSVTSTCQLVQLALSYKVSWLQSRPKVAKRYTIYHTPTNA